jgi:hypothetical protein
LNFSHRLPVSPSYFFLSAFRLNTLKSAVHQRRFLIGAVVVIVGIWLLAMAGHWYLESIKMTADKVRAYVTSVDFAQLTGDARARAIRKLEDDLNALSYEERQQLRMQHTVRLWFDQMTEEEKSQFLEATLPTGFKQMINAFQQMPEDKRRRLIDSTMKNLQKANNQAQANGGTNGPPLSPELEAKVRTIGLDTFYSQSSAETKAELAPVLEELQHQMETEKIQRPQ